MADLLPSRDTLIAIGVTLSIAVMVLMNFLEYKFTFRTLLLIAITALASIPGEIFGEALRKLTYGNWGSFISDFSQYEGTHYLGRAIYTIISAFLLWHIIMRNRTPSFAKEGRNRFLDVLSVFMLIQIIFARLGCISLGCCVGRTHYGFLSVYNPALDCSVFPAVHTELIISLITLAVVIVLYIKRKNAFSAFCIGYSIALFVAECMYDSAGTVKVFGLTIVQLLAVAVLLTGIVFGFIAAEYNKKMRG